MKYGRSTRERWYLYGKSAGLGTGGTNGEVGSGWRAVPSAEVVKGGESVKGPRLCGFALWHAETSAIINQTPGNYPKENLLCFNLLETVKHNKYVGHRLQGVLYKFNRTTCFIQLRPSSGP